MSRSCRPVRCARGRRAGSGIRYIVGGRFTGSPAEEEEDCHSRNRMGRDKLSEDSRLQAFRRADRITTELLHFHSITPECDCRHRGGEERHGANPSYHPEERCGVPRGRMHQDRSGE